MRWIALILAAGAAAGICASAHASTVWLCHPGKKADPCTRSLTFTAVRSDGSAKVYKVGIKRQQPIDCFYVYPTVSLQHRGNSTLEIEQQETDVARLQASWFSPICRVFAPMYRQVTAYANDRNGDGNLAYADVRDAWRDYLAHDNHGRGVVLLGHSQGSFRLKELIQKEIENKPNVRKLLVSAVLLGGNVVVGKGGDFVHVPPCASKTQFGCVVAFSTWDKAPPSNASFERVGNADQRVLCVNPAAPGGGAKAAVTPLFLSTDFSEWGGISPGLFMAVNTDWISYPGLYQARCVQRGSMAWLEVKPVTAVDKRPTVKPLGGPTWGLHTIDMNVALFELVGLVATQATAYAAHR